MMTNAAPSHDLKSTSVDAAGAADDVPVEPPFRRGIYVFVVLVFVLWVVLLVVFQRAFS